MTTSLISLHHKNISFFNHCVLLYACMFLFVANILGSLPFIVKFLFQIYTDFEEIRQEIEAETERMSGNNKVC